MRLGHTLVAGYALAGAIAAAGACTVGASVTGTCEKITPSAATLSAVSTPTATASALFRANISGSVIATAVGEATGYNWTFVSGVSPVVAKAKVFGTTAVVATSAVTPSATCVADAQRIRQVQGSSSCTATGTAEAKTDVARRGGITCSSTLIGEPAIQYGGTGGLYRDASGVVEAGSTAATAVQSVSYVPTAAIGYSSAEADAQRIQVGEGSAEGVAEVVSHASNHWFPVLASVSVSSSAAVLNTTATRIGGGVAGAITAAAGGASTVAIGVGDAPVGARADTLAEATLLRIGGGLALGTAAVAGDGEANVFASGDIAGSATVSGYMRVNDYTLAPDFRTYSLSAAARELVVPSDDRLLKVA
jgi:trimeric autotransporter adhesin